MKLNIPERPWLLLVEDSPADVYLVQEAVRQEGLDYEWGVAEDGESAIHLIDMLDADAHVSAPNILLLDINIPRRTGNQVLQRFRSSTRCSNVPVVMISSSDSAPERQRARDLGANEYFRKPSSLDEFMLLGAIVRRLIHGRTMRAGG
jgi:CheY-like chemotaxis protein